MNKILYKAVEKKIKNRFIVRYITMILEKVLIFKYCIIRMTSRKASQHYDEKKALEILEAYSPKPKVETVILPLKDNNKYDLSIIVPAYNVEQYIDACIKSLLSQTTRYKCQIIIINDGCTDNTSIILKKYENFEFVNIIEQKNAGLSAARNTGIALAEGKYLMFVDSDDLLAENAVNNLLEYAFQYDLDIAVGGYQIFSDENELPNNVEKVVKQRGIFRQHDLDKILELHGFAWGKVYKRKLFKTIRFPEGYWFEDTIVHCLLYLICKSAGNIPESVYNYRVNQQGITKSSKYSPKTLQTLWIAEEIIKQYRNHIIEKNEQFYQMIMGLLSQVLYNRVHFAGDEIMKQAFIVACSYVDSIRKSLCLSSRVKNSTLEKSFIMRDYILWKERCRLISYGVNIQD